MGETSEEKRPDSGRLWSRDVAVREEKVFVLLQSEKDGV
jgi:hypothetical protein